MDKSANQDDIIMVESMNATSLDAYGNKLERSYSTNSNDSSISILYSPGDHNQQGPPSIRTACDSGGPPLEQREDIIETKGIPDRLKDMLNFNDEMKIHEVEEQMKARENIDMDMEHEIEKIKNIGSNKLLEDPKLLKAAQIASEKIKDARTSATDGNTTLKRAMEVIDVALPRFAIVCVKSYEVNDLSEQVGIEIQQYETCLLEKQQAALNFEVGQAKTIEAFKHLDECIKLAGEDEKTISEKKKTEEQLERVKSFTDAKGEMDDIINGELDEVHSWLRSCKSDLENINALQEEQTKRFNYASKNYEKGDQTFQMKINASKQHRDDLEKQLETSKREENMLIQGRMFQQQVQGKAKECNDRVLEQLNGLQKSISSIQTCATASLKVMESMKECGGTLLSASIEAEEEYLAHLNDLDIEAKTKLRLALATNAVETKLSIDNTAGNIDEYQEKYNNLKEDLKKAVQRQQRLESDRVKKDMKEYKEEIKQEERKKKEAEESLKRLLITIFESDENLLKLGRQVDSVDSLYEWRKQEMAANCPEFASIDFSEDDNDDEDDDDKDGEE